MSITGGVSGQDLAGHSVKRQGCDDLSTRRIKFGSVEEIGESFSEFDSVHEVRRVFQCCPECSWFAGLQPDDSCLNVETSSLMVSVVVFEFMLVLVDDGVDFCGGLCGGLSSLLCGLAFFFLTLAFCPDELVVWICCAYSL